MRSGADKNPQRLMLVARCCLFCCLSLVAQVGLADAPNFKAAEQGQAEAQYNLGCLLRQGPRRRERRCKGGGLVSKRR